MSDNTVVTVVSGHTFTINRKYDLAGSKVLGAGSFGVVSNMIINIRANVMYQLRLLQGPT